ncbi:MAG: carbohydrate kinase family protein [Anaerolineae bacterium]|nr:carbohydrate kinase family protein [Anaerolineae bacterium]
MFDVICVGDVALDDYYSLAHLPGPDEKVHVQFTGRAIGGTTCNTARALKSLGADVLFLTKIGEDENGQYIQGAFSRLGLSARYLKTSRTPIAQILVAKGGEKAILLHGFDDAHRWDAVELAEFMAPAPAKAVFSTLSLPMREALTQFGAELVISLEPAILEWDAWAFGWATSYAHTIILDRHAFRMLFNQEATEESLSGAFDGLKNQPQRLIVTLGSKGSLAVSRQPRAVYACAAFAVPVVDTTGAGDIFNAAYLAATFVKKAPLREALRYANAVAAASCTASGTDLTASILEKAEMLVQSNPAADLL